jgi:hypothetical protein
VWKPLQKAKLGPKIEVNGLKRGQKVALCSAASFSPCLLLLASEGLDPTSVFADCLIRCCKAPAAKHKCCDQSIASD